MGCSIQCKSLYILGLYKLLTTFHVVAWFQPNLYQWKVQILLYAPFSCAFHCSFHLSFLWCPVLVEWTFPLVFGQHDWKHSSFLKSIATPTVSVATYLPSKSCAEVPATHLWMKSWCDCVSWEAPWLITNKHDFSDVHPPPTELEWCLKKK